VWRDVLDRGRGVKRAVLGVLLFITAFNVVCFGVNVYAVAAMDGDSGNAAVAVANVAAALYTFLTWRRLA
jgi:choline-glycine betaine transporter